MAVTVFTNGCFDIIHPGHVDLLTRAKALGTRLVVGINGDDSVRAIKGDGRPFVPAADRKRILEALKPVDEVIIFDELTPEMLIKELRPDVLIKGGDWQENEIIGADFVRENGGKVLSLQLTDGYSSSSVVDRIRSVETNPAGAIEDDNLVMRSIDEHRAAVTATQRGIAADIERAGALIIETFHNNGKLLVCGNGGSAADAQHLAAEFVGRYESERISLPAIALTTDTSALTAISNDFGYDSVFARQVSGLANSGDCIVAISTSGSSANIISAVMAARERGCKTIALTGEGGKKLASLCDASVMVPASRTARIQEIHIIICHIWCEMVDQAYGPI